MLIDLDESGILHYDILIEYYQGLLSYIKSSYSNLKLLELMKVIIHISNTFSEEIPKLKSPSILNLPSFETIYEAFNRIYFYHFKKEASFLQMYELDLDLTELKLLTLSYIFEEAGLNQPSALNEKHLYNFHDIIIIHKLDKGFIQREVGKMDKEN